MEDIFMPNSQNEQLLNLLQLVLAEVKTLSTDVQEIKLSQQTLAANQQTLATNQEAFATNQEAFAVELGEVKSDVREIKAWARVTDKRLDNMENKIVDFATQLSNLDEKVETRLYDTRPIWQSVLERLDKIESDLASVKENQEKSEQSAQEFRQELLSRFRQLEKDLSFYRKHAQVDAAALAKDIINIEERLEKVESKLEIKN
jgi:chromosome segregation ATPase